MKNRTAIITVVFLLVIVALAGAFTYYHTTTKAAKERNVAAKNLISSDQKQAYTDINGLEFDISSYTKQSIVVTAWASWCPQCADELIQLNTVMEARGDKAVPVLAINRSESKDMAARFISTLPRLQKITFILDTTDYFFGAVAGYAMPETIVYNDAGEVIFHGHGNTDKQALEDSLNIIKP